MTQTTTAKRPRGTAGIWARVDPAVAARMRALWVEADRALRGADPEFVFVVAEMASHERARQDRLVAQV